MFSTDAVLQQAVLTWIEQGQYEKCADLWTKGLQFDWELLYRQQGSRPKRISLPTYSFARERHWIDVEPLQGNARTQQAALVAYRSRSSDLLEKLARNECSESQFILELRNAYV